MQFSFRPLHVKTVFFRKIPKIFRKRPNQTKKNHHSLTGWLKKITKSMSSFGPCDVDVKITGCMGYTKKTGGTLVFDDRGVNWVDKLQSNQTIPFNAYYPRIKRIAKTPRLNKLKLCLSDNNEGDGIEIIFENKKIEINVLTNC